MSQDLTGNSCDSDITHSPTRDSICALEVALSQDKAASEEALSKCILTHTFSDGSYARQMLIPAGTIVVGKIHKHAHLNIVSRGRVHVATEFGFDVIDAINNPVTFSSIPGTKRAVYAETDVYWTTIHLTTKTDLKEIEAEIIAESFDDLLLPNSTERYLP